MESPHPRVWCVLLALAGLALFITLCGDAVGPQHLAAMRARADELEAKQAAARAVVLRAEERWPDDPDRMWAESSSAEWLNAEDWAELLELRERLGRPLVAESDGWSGQLAPPIVRTTSSGR